MTRLAESMDRLAATETADMAVRHPAHDPPPQRGRPARWVALALVGVAVGIVAVGGLVLWSDSPDSS